MPKPSPIDLCTLAAAKAWIPITNNGGDANIQGCITAWSLNFLRMTGRGPRDWQTATQSPFNEPVDYAEVYDSNGNSRLFLRNFPINSVASLSINGADIPARGHNPTSPGYVVDNQGRSIAMSAHQGSYRGAYGIPYGGLWGGGGARMQGKRSGIQNVLISYNAGFNSQKIVNELYKIPTPWKPSTVYATGSVVCDGAFLQVAINSGESGTAAPPWAANPSGTTVDGTDMPIIWQNTGTVVALNTVSVDSETIILADGGVLYFANGTALTPVLIAPNAGEYYLVSPGVYLFNAADAGKQVQISYTAAGTPADIVQAAKQAVSLNYKRRDWEGISSLSMKDVGQTTYTQFAMSNDVRDVVRNYTRASLAS